VSHIPADAVSQPMTSERASVTYGRPVTSRLTPEEVPSESTAQMEKAQQFINNKAACFKFNFSVSNAVTEVLTDCSANGSGINAGDSGASASAGECCSVSSDPLTQDGRDAEANGHCYAVKTLPSDNSFRFNFTKAQDDNPLKNYQT